MSRSIELKATMGPAVVDFLRQFGTLPETGIVAGQSVASAIDALYGRHPPIVNDVDIFRRVRKNPKVAASKANKTATRMKFTSIDFQALETPYDGMAEILRIIDSYSIQSTRRDGMLNFINVTAPQGLDEDLSVGQILTGFDINCVRVGVELRTGQLVWCRSFERFLATRQLELRAMHTPGHTFLRYVKKMAEVPGAYGDIDAAAEICAAIEHCAFLRKMREASVVSMMFGQKMHELARSHESATRPFFELERFDFRKCGSATSPSWRDLTQHDTDVVDLSLWGLRARGTADPAIQAKVDRLGTAALLFGPQVVYETRRRKSAGVYVKMDRLRALAEKQPRSALAVCLDVFGTACVQGHSPDGLASKVDSFLSKHPAFAGALMGLCVADQAATVDRVNRVAKEYEGVATLGVLESLASPVDLESEHAMRAVIEADMKAGSAVFAITPLRLPMLPPALASYQVEELLTAGDLRRESGDMSHCVAGYKSLVRRNQVRILRIRPRVAALRANKDLWSTLELRDNRGEGSTAFGQRSRLMASQHRGRFNKAPSAENAAVAEFVVSAYGKSNLDLMLLRIGATQAVGVLLDAAIGRAQALHGWLTQRMKAAGFAISLAKRRSDERQRVHAALRRAMGGDTSLPSQRKQEDFVDMHEEDLLF